MRASGARRSRLAEPIRRALEPLYRSHQGIAQVYGSVDEGTDTAGSDVDLFVVADGVMLEEVYAERSPEKAIASAAGSVPRSIRRRSSKNAEPLETSIVVANVLAGEHIVLIGGEGAAPATR